MSVLKATIKNLEDAAEEEREHYRKDGEVYVLNVEASDGYALENVQALKSSLRKERDNFNTAEAALKRQGMAWSDESRRWEGGIDPGEHEQLVERVKELELIDPTKEADKLAGEKFKALEVQLKDKHGREISEAEAARKAVLDELKREKISLRVAQAISAVGGSSALQTLLEHEADMKEVDGKYQVVILKDGEPRITQKGQDTGWMGFEERLEEMRADDAYKGLFPSKVHPGGGSTTTASRDTGRKADSGETISSRDRDAVSANLDGIAKGEVKVAFGDRAG